MRIPQHIRNIVVFRFYYFIKVTYVIIVKLSKLNLLIVFSLCIKNYYYNAIF